MLDRTSRTAVSVLLSLVFTAGLAGEAYGAHDCRHHDRDRAPRAESGEGLAVEPAAAADAAPVAPLEAPPEGPCTCVGNCHSASVALDTGIRPIVPSGPEADRGLSVSAPRDRLPRPRAYLLPFANAPPVRA